MNPVLPKMFFAKESRYVLSVKRRSQPVLVIAVPQLHADVSSVLAVLRDERRHIKIVRVCWGKNLFEPGCI